MIGVDRLPSGSYRARLMVDGQTYTATFPSEEDAREWLVVIRGRVVGGRAARRLTVEQYAHRWLGEFIDTAPAVDRYRRDVVEAILPALGSRALVEVTPVDIAALFEQANMDTSPAVADQGRATLGGTVHRRRGRRHHREEPSVGLAARSLAARTASTHRLSHGVLSSYAPGAASAAKTATAAGWYQRTSGEEGWT